VTLSVSLGQRRNEAKRRLEIDAASERREDVLPAARLWVRASDYLIEDGLIRADPQANFQAYDPFEADRQATTEEDRPYKALLRLAQRVDLNRGDRELGKRERADLERWLVSNGLLGMLPHETLSFTTWPRWRARPPELQAHEGQTLYGAYQRSVHRTAAGWRTHMELVGPELPEGSVEPEGEVPAELLSEAVRPIEVTYRRWPGGAIERKALRSWRTYFPDLSPPAADRFDYPSFSGEEFWILYAEPLSVFLAPVKRLVKVLGIFERGKPTENKWGQRNAAAALSEINDAAFGTHVSCYIADDAEVQIGWAAPSLFGAFAVMLLKDLAAGQQVLRCPICGGVFLSAAYQARFCSSTCRFTHHKREQRSRDKETS
jgi:hypothetical protein